MILKKFRQPDKSLEFFFTPTGYAIEHQHTGAISWNGMGITIWTRVEPVWAGLRRVGKVFADRQFLSGTRNRFIIVMRMSRYDDK